jgi:hypothetical protein
MAAAALSLTLGACASTGSASLPGPPVHRPTPAASTVPPTVPPAPSPQPTVTYTWKPTACGVERWHVKTGTDPGAATINLRTALVTTVAALGAIKAPAVLPPGSRIPPVETTVYRVAATLIAVRPEADSDYHLVLSDAGHTMIAEIPNPACVGSGSPLLPGIELARTEFDAHHLVTADTETFAHVSVPVVVTGIGFFDSIHGQTGVAPNGIEIHPVLSIQWGAP